MLMIWTARSFLKPSTFGPGYAKSQSVTQPSGKGFPLVVSAVSAKIVCILLRQRNRSQKNVETLAIRGKPWISFLEG